MTTTPFDRLRPLSVDLANKGNEALKALDISPELGCGALRIWLEAGVIRFLEERNNLLPLTGASALDNSVERLFEHGIINQQQRSQFDKIRKEGNTGLHGRVVELSIAHSNFRYAGAICGWLLGYEPSTAQASTEQPRASAAPHVAAVLPSELEQFFNFRKLRASGQSNW